MKQTTHSRQGRLAERPVQRVSTAASDSKPLASVPPDFKAMTLRELRKLGAEAEEHTEGDYTTKSAARMASLRAAFVVPTEVNELEFLAVCQRIYQDNRGCSTPFEGLVCSMVHWAAICAPTPIHVLREMEAFQENWNEAIQNAHFLYLCYPKLVINAEEVSSDAAA